MSSEDTSPVIGIDLGTTYTCVAVVRGDDVTIIPSEMGRHNMASYVYFKETGERIVGDIAKEQCVRNPRNTIYGVKRFIGQTYKEVKQPSNFSYTIINKDDHPAISVEVKGQEKMFAPEEISAIVLGKIKDRAEEYLNTPINRAVITVPAHFNDTQRQATKNAGNIAGLQVLRIINEPTAAALAYELTNKYNSSKSNVLIYDFGGGTFDVSIVSIENEIIEVLATNGEEYLGGDDIDKRLTEYMFAQFKSDGKCDGGRHKIMSRLQYQSEKVKLNLSSQQNIMIDIDLLDGKNDLSININRTKFVELNEDLFLKTLKCVEKTLSDAKLKKSDIQEIVLVGGSSRIPHVRKMVQEYFDNKQLNASLNPDEAVAIGAARQGAILSGHISPKISVSLKDVSSLSLGIKTKDGIMSVVIQRHTKVPVKIEKDYKTRDGQDSADISIYEGEGKFVDDNRQLGKFKLTGLTSSPTEQNIVKISFEINLDGILNVTAEDKRTANKSYFTTEYVKDDFSNDDIKQMMADATKYKEEENKRKLGMKAMNELDIYCFEVLNELKQSDIVGTKRNIVEDKCKEVQKWVIDNFNLNAEDYESKKAELSELLNNYDIKMKFVK